MKKILLIATGGTIASGRSETGLTPLLSTDELLCAVPELSGICQIETLELYNLDSTNMCYTEWIGVAEAVRDNYDSYDGFVVTHGTDTMAYAAATLSYLIQNNKKPVVLTGAQRSISARDTDARNNLKNAFIYACYPDASGVTVVFDGKVICGTRARKSRTKSFNAFSSIDYPELAIIREDNVIPYIKLETCGDVSFFTELDPAVISLRIIPGMDADIFDFLAARYHAVVLECFGVGGIPDYDDERFDRGIATLIANGVKVIITTQVPYEGSDMTVYRVGYKVKKKYELIEAYNMTTEAVIAKTMWALARPEDFKESFEKPIAKDII